MKTILISGCLMAGLLAPAALAETGVVGKAKSKPAKSAVPQVCPACVKSGCGSTNASQTETITTGSRLPQKVQRNRQITDAASPVTVFDQKDIQTSGASSVEELLRRRGVTR